MFCITILDVGRFNSIDNKSLKAAAVSIQEEINRIWIFEHSKYTYSIVRNFLFRANSQLKEESNGCFVIESYLGM